MWPTWLLMLKHFTPLTVKPMSLALLLPKIIQITVNQPLPVHDAAAA